MERPKGKQTLARRKTSARGFLGGVRYVCHADGIINANALPKQGFMTSVIVG